MTATLNNEESIMFPTADAMINLWNRPDSTRRLKYATWALARALRKGCDVLESPRVMESMRMAAAEGGAL
jgi:hypothetical protein